MRGGVRRVTPCWRRRSDGPATCGARRRRSETPIEAIRQLAQDDRFALAPIVILVKPKETLILERIADLERAKGTLLLYNNVIIDEED